MWQLREKSTFRASIETGSLGEKAQSPVSGGERAWAAGPL